MKKPFFTQYQRQTTTLIDLEIAKLKFKREFEKTNLFRFMDHLIIKLGKLLS